MLFIVAVVLGVRDMTISTVVIILLFFVFLVFYAATINVANAKFINSMLTSKSLDKSLSSQVAVINSLNFGVLKLSCEGKIDFINRKGLEILGLKNNVVKSPAESVFAVKPIISLLNEQIDMFLIKPLENYIIEIRTDQSERRIPLKISTFPIWQPNEPVLDGFVIVFQIALGDDVIIKEHNKKVLRKIWDRSIKSPINVFSNYLKKTEEVFDGFTSNIMLSQHNKKDLDALEILIRNSRKDIANLKIITYGYQLSLGEMDSFAFGKLLDLEFKNYLSGFGKKIRVTNRLSKSKDRVVALADNQGSKIIFTNIVSNFAEFSDCTVIDVVIDQTYYIPNSSNMLTITFTGVDSKIEDSILEKIKKNEMFSSLPNEHLGFGMGAVKKLVLEHKGKIEFFNSAEGFSVAIGFPTLPPQ